MSLTRRTSARGSSARPCSLPTMHRGRPPILARRGEHATGDRRGVEEGGSPVRLEPGLSERECRCSTETDVTLHLPVTNEDHDSLPGPSSSSRPAHPATRQAPPGPPAAEIELRLLQATVPLDT
uniref:Uncharacterized protein n=1 Tax=Branchiostoma floridae TaxID=7739 RepID=C3YGT1_BRAFL|eukprot:XP_002604391.1 hypothetical protein BRAFLDRAFT_79306 [Branchiostoma floridae]